MTDDAKEWVTIKIPESIRDDASEDPRTYGEIMRAGLGDSDDGDTDRQHSIDVADARLLSQHVERAFAPYFADLVDVDDASEIRGALSVEVDDSEIAQELARQLDYTALANKVADKVGDRMR